MRLLQAQSRTDGKRFTGFRIFLRFWISRSGGRVEGLALPSPCLRGEERTRASSSPRPVSGLASVEGGKRGTGPSLSICCTWPVSRAPPAFLPYRRRQAFAPRCPGQGLVLWAHHPVHHRQCTEPAPTLPLDTRCAPSFPWKRERIMGQAATGVEKLPRIFLHAALDLSPCERERDFNQLTGVKRGLSC